MSLLEIFVLAIVLALDAFSVGAAVGLKHRAPRQVFRLSFHFGLFQALLPLAGALAGSVLLQYIKAWDHWVVFGILAVLGIRMIHGAVAGKAEEEIKVDLTRGLSLVGLSVAVSIDALAAGVSLGASGAPIAISVGIIGVVAALATAIAMLGAQRIPRGAAKKTEAVGGVVLILLGAKTVVEHLQLLSY